MTMPADIRQALERLKGEVAHIIDEERRATRLNLRSMRRHRVDQIARLNDALSVLEQLTDNKEPSSARAEEITVPQRMPVSGGCPECGSQSVDYAYTVEDPIDGLLDHFVCHSCGNWWDEPTEDEDEESDDPTLDEKCPFCRSSNVVLSGDYHHCNFCDSTFDEDGNVVIDDEDTPIIPMHPITGLDHEDS